MCIWIFRIVNTSCGGTYNPMYLVVYTMFIYMHVSCNSHDALMINAQQQYNVRVVPPIWWCCGLRTGNAEGHYLRVNNVLGVCVCVCYGFFPRDVAGTRRIFPNETFQVSSKHCNVQQISNQNRFAHPARLFRIVGAINLSTIGRRLQCRYTAFPCSIKMFWRVGPNRSVMNQGRTSKVKVIPIWYRDVVLPDL